MERLLKLLVNIIRYLFVATIALFSIATFIGKSYLPTFMLLTLAASIVYWPTYFAKKWDNRISLISRSAVIGLLLIFNVFLLKPSPKNSIYFSKKDKEKLIDIYDLKMAEWPENTEDIFIPTEYGKVHCLTCGQLENPPLIMIHAASMGAHSWADNLKPLLDHYRIYSFDNIGEGNKSELNDAMHYPKNGKEIAELYAQLADSLGVKRSPVFGASNGGFVAMNYAYHYPERVESLALFGPMGLTQLTASSIINLSIASMYPFDFVKDHVFKWAMGKDEYVVNKYEDWFTCILEGTMPSLATPVPMTTEQKKKMDLPILLFLGTKDNIVGNAEFAKKTAREFPNIKIEILESGHLIAVEHFGVINKKLRKFLQIE